jgi:hypothetical protein
MSQKLTVLCFPASGQEIPKEPLKATIELVVSNPTENSQFAAPRSKEGDIRIKTAILTSSKSPEQMKRNSQNTVANTSKRIPTMMEEEEDDEEPKGSVNTGILVEAFPFTELKELKTRCLSIQFEDSSVLGNKHFLIPLASISDNLPTYLKTETQEWDGLFTAEKKLLVVRFRFPSKTSSNPVELTEDSMQQELKYMYKVKDQYPEHLQLILMKVDDLAFRDEDSSSGDNRLIITKDEVTRLRLQTFDADSTELPLDSDRSLDDLPKYSDLRAKLKVLFQDINSVKVFTDIKVGKEMKQSEILRHCETIRQTLTDLMKNTPAVRDRLFIVHYVGVEFFKKDFRTIGASYSLLTSFKKNERLLTMSEKASIWMSHVLGFGNHLGPALLDQIVRSSSSLKMSDLCFIEATPTGTRLEDIFGYYEDKNEIECPILNFIIKNLVNSSTSGYFTNDSEDMTPAFRDLSNLVFSRCCQETRDLLWEKLLYRDMHPGLESIEASMISESQLAPEDLNMAVVYYCCLQETESQLSSAFYQYLRTHFRQVGTTIFEILYHIASEGMTSKQEELGQNLDNFLFGRFRQKEDQDVFAYFKQLFTEKVQREESLNLAAYIFKNEEIFSMQEKRRLFEDLASSTLTHPKSFALKVLKKLIERNQSFVSLIIPETLLGPDGALLILEDCLRPAVEIWKKEGNLNNSKKETVIYFAENCKNSKENAKIASICYFLADLYLGSPQMAANISKLSSSFFVQVFLSVSEFIQKETSISNMLISTIDSLVELKEKLECLEKFEKIDPNKEISLSRRVESASEKEKILAKSMELIQDSIQIIAEADSRIGRQPFVEKAQQAIGRLKNNYKSYTVSGVESSTEYLDLVILTQSHFSIFKALKDREPFIGLLTKNEASSCRGFIKNIAEAKVVLREDLHKLAFDSKKLTVGLTEVYFPDISVENGEHCRRMLAGLELDDQSTKTLINRSKELRAGKHLLQIIQESKIDEKNETSLERLVQLQAFNNSKKESFEIIKGIVALKQAFFRRFPVQSAIDEVEYHFFEAHDKIQLRNFDCFLDIDIKRLDEFSRMHRLIEFLLKDIKEEKLMKKLKDDLNTNKWDLLDKLKKSYSDLKFLLTPKDSSQALLIDCLKRCTARSTKEQDDLLALITYMRKNLSDFEHEQRKAMGDFTDIVQSLMANSLFILEHDSETNSFLLAAKELEKENFKTPEDFEKGGLESFKENEEFGGNFYKVGSFFNAEELHDHRAKARILKEQMGHLTEDKTQSQKLEKVIGLVEITDSLEAIQASLIQLFLIGLVSKNFQSPLINNLIQKNSNSRFMKVIDKNSKLVFHIKDAKCSILTTIKEELQAKANQATEEYLGLINMNENHLLTYFTQEKMDILIRCLDSDVSTWYQDENRGLIEILKESLDIPDSELSVAVKKTNFKGGKIVEKVYHIHKKDEQKGESRTFECIVGCLREFSQYRAKGQDNKDIFGLDKKVSYIDVEAHLNQYEFLLLLIRQQNKHASKWSYVSQILYCDETVSHVELLAFLNRCFRDDLRRIYAVLNPAGLPHHLLKVLTDFVENNNKEDMRVNRRLVIFNNLSSSEAFQNQDHFNHIRLKSIQDSAFLDKSVLFGAYQEKLQAIKVVSSDRPGDGKTSWIRDQHDHDKKANRSRLILELGLTGEVNKRYIEQLFLGLEKGIPKGSDKEGNSRTNKFDIHIKIDYIDCFIENKGLIDYFLFSVCFMGKFGVKGKLIDIGDLVNKVYIEIGNSIKHLLVGSTQRHLDIVSLLYDLKSSVDKGKSLIVPLPAFSKEGIKYDPNPDSPMQLAAFYLSVKEQFLSGLHSGSVIDCCKNQHQAVPRDQYQRLLYTYFQQANKKSPETYYNFQFWIRVLNQQASRTLEWLSKLQEEEPVSASNPLVKSVGLEDLAKELFLESVESSNSIIGLHSAQAREKQAIAKIIFDLHARRDHLSKSSMQRDVQEIADIDRRIEDEENKLRKKVLEEEEMSDSWNTDNIFFTLISGTSFLPVIGSLDHFNKRTVENLELATVKQDKQKGDQKTKKEDSYLIKGISISTKRYIAYLREQFAGKLSDFDSSRRFNLGHSDEHLWYVFCLAQLAFLTSNLPGTTSHKDKISKSFAKIRESAQNFDEGKGFVLTKQTYMKLCLMMLKADLRTPIIIMGESGCGKTYLSQFLVKELCQDKLKMVSLYSGFDEQELIYEILEATSEAEELKADKGKPNKKLWIFFDEFNTTTLQGLIADIMIDRTVPSYYFKQQKYLKRDPSDKTKAAFPEKALYNSLEGESLKLPDNICFIACCNPFLIKLKKNSEENIGLVPNEKTSHLSHIVHPLPDRILALVWDFGQLPEEEEKSHILNMVKAAKLFSLNRPGMTTAKVVQYNERMAGFIHRAHKAVREIEERSGVSLRDINRVFLFFKWFQSQMPLLRDYHAWVTSEDNRALKNCGRIRLRNTWIFESEDSQEVASAICSIIICYSLKLNGQQENQKKLFDIIHNWAKHAIGVISLTRSEALSCLNTIAEIYLHQIKDKFIEENIALNNPLKENFMTLLACYAVRVPLIIVGAPGTSKTLCTSILKKIVGPAKNDPSMTLFRNLETGTWLDYCGSEATTPTIITRIFEKVKSWYQDYEKTKKKGSSSDSNSDKTDLPGIFFDELGHAEKSPHNPLKVMHSHLENFLGKIPFISISNWRPDQSKVNRMVCLSRPDLTKLDLLDIFSSTFKEIKSSQTVESFVREAFDKMSQCYLNYREWQRHTSPNKMYHRDFHGSRDIYAMIKFIILELKKLVLKTEKDIQDMEITTQLQQSLTESAIEESDVCKKKVYFRVFFLDVLNIFKDAIERNLNGEIYKFGDDPEAKAAFPELISPEFLKRVKRTELIRDDFYSNYVEEFARDKTVHETLDEFLEINFLKTRESARFNKDKMFSLTSSEVFKIFFMNQICSKVSIDQNFSKEIIDNNFMIWPILTPNFERFDRTCIKKFLKDNEDVMRTLRQNIETTLEKGVDCRFIAIRTEGTIMDDFLVNNLGICLRRIEEEKRKELKTKGIKNGKLNVCKGIIDLRVSGNCGKLEDILSQLKTYITEGYLVVMKNLDHIYPGLYELFNQKDENCSLYYGLTPQKVTVHPNFKCVVILPTGSNIRRNNQIEKIQPAPFLNRFEKYYYGISSVLKYGKMEKIQRIMTQAKQIMKENPSFLLGFSIDSLITISISDSEHFSSKKETRSGKSEEKGSNKDSLDSLIEQRFYRLMTANYLVSNSSMKVKEIKTFKKAHKGKLFGQLLGGNAQKSSLQPINPVKHFVFTFTGLKRLKEIVETSSATDSWIVLDGKDIATSGGFRMAKKFSSLVEESDKTLQKQKLIVSFESPSDFDIIRQLKSQIDQRNLGQEGIRAFTDVIFALHVSRDPKNRRFLERSLGISYSQGWDLVVIDNLDPSFSYDFVFGIKNKTIENVILDDCLPDSRFGDEDSSEIEKCKDDGEHRIGETVLRRVLTSIIETLIYQLKGAQVPKNSVSKNRRAHYRHEDLAKGCKFDKLKEWFSPKLNSSSKHPSSQLMFSKLAGLIKSRLKSTDMGDLKVTQALERMLKGTESYSDIELHLGQLFYDSHRNEIADILWTLNSQCRSLPSLIFGLELIINDEKRETQQQELMIADYFAVLDNAIQIMLDSKSSDELKIPLSEPRAFYMPFSFRQAFSHAKADFKKEIKRLYRDCASMGELADNAKKLFIRTISLDDGSNKTNILDDGTRKRKSGVIAHLRQHEFWITKLVTKIFSERIEPLVLNFNIDLLDGNDSTLRNMLVVDWLNSIEYATFADDYSIETMKEFVTVCFELSKVIKGDEIQEMEDEDFKKDQTDFTKGLATATIITSFFDDIARSLLDLIESSKGKALELIKMDTRKKNTMVNYMSLFDLEAKMRNEAMCASIDLQQVTKQQIARLSTSAELQKGPGSAILSVLYGMISVAGDDSYKRLFDELRHKMMQDSTNSSCHSTLKSSVHLIHAVLVQLKECRQRLVGRQSSGSSVTSTDQRSLRKEVARYLDKIHAFVAVWMEELKNLDILKDANVTRFLEDRSFITEEEYRKIILKAVKKASEWASKVFRVDKDRIESRPSLVDIQNIQLSLKDTDEKDTDEKDKDKKNKDKNDADMELPSLDSFIRRAFSERSLNFAVFSLLESICRRMSKWDQKIGFDDLLEQATEVG